MYIGDIISQQFEQRLNAEFVGVPELCCIFNHSNVRLMILTHSTITMSRNVYSDMCKLYT